MNKLIVIMGPTAVGKTATAIAMAREVGCEILSFDSRQFYSELNIGVARPSEEELSMAKHHFIACRSVQDPYNIFQYEQEALAKLEQLFAACDTAIAVGGSGLYAEALCHGVALLPDPTPELRQRLSAQLQSEGAAALLAQLEVLDPEYSKVVDRSNGVRIQRALEVCLMSGKPYSQMIVDSRKMRPFEIEYCVVAAAPEVLRQRIDRRVDMMMEAGLLQEVERVAKYRHLNTLNTVGYKEIFAYMDGTITKEDAVRQIKWHTWQYAKKQLTWIKKKVPEATILEKSIAF